ncbi:hypothetical protein [Streptomyces sp. RTGN2]|uniref:hypothetical protein n=1 Tax=Streptomyces sp. RTGN2 TaxID=3016525 RepID=UPI002552A3C8|nr:hypothetical protein [Streptomyces sp. RTGN2]
MASRSNYGRSSLRRPCGRPTASGSPCKILTRPGYGCRHHQTPEERAATAAKHPPRSYQATSARTRRQQAKDAKNARDERIGVALLMASLVLVLAFLGVVALSSLWDDDGSGCQRYTSQVSSLNVQADRVSIPLVSLLDPDVAPLQTGRQLPRFSADSSVASEEDVKYGYREKRELAGRAAQIVLTHQDCFSDDRVATAARVKGLPVEVTSVEMPTGPHCADGWPSSSIGEQGACSHHGGVVSGTWAVLHF